MSGFDNDSAEVLSSPDVVSHPYRILVSLVKGAIVLLAAVVTQASNF